MHQVLVAQAHLDEESDTGSSGSDSSSPEQYCSSSPDVIFLGKNEEGPADAEGEKNGSDDEKTLSLLDISNSDNEEARKAAAHIRHARVMSCTLPGETGRFARVMTI